MNKTLVDMKKYKRGKGDNFGGQAGLGSCKAEFCNNQSKINLFKIKQIKQSQCGRGMVTRTFKILELHHSNENRNED